MSSKEVIELEANGVRFYSASDEAMFFNWLRNLSCVVQIEGRGLGLYISVKVSMVDEDALRELLALFRRYSIDMRQLAQFDLAVHAEWFRDPAAYWAKAVFG